MPDGNTETKTYARKDNATPAEMVAGVGNSDAWHARENAPGFMQITIDKFSLEDRAVLINAYVFNSSVTQAKYHVRPYFDATKVDALIIEQDDAEKDINGKATITVPLALYNQIRHHYAPDAEKQKYPVPDEGPKHSRPIRTHPTLMTLHSALPDDVRETLQQSGVRNGGDLQLNGELVGMAYPSPKVAGTDAAPKPHRK